MKRVVFVGLICLFVAVSLVACTSAEERRNAEATEIAASIFATQTAEAPTVTPTPSPTLTPTFTPTPKPTDTPLPSPTPSLVPTSAPEPTVASAPLEEGWQEFSAAGFYIALPERWQVVDLDEEGLEALLDFLEGLDNEWAQGVGSMITAEAMQESMKLWAMDPEPAGVGFATLNVQYQAQPFAMTPDVMLIQLEAVYEQMGVELVSSESDMEINGLAAARVEIRMPVGPFSIRQFQYLYARDRDLWIVTLAVDENVWPEYEPVFTQIAESFRVETR